jgi:hypothetical protein
MGTPHELEPIEAEEISEVEPELKGDLGNEDNEQASGGLT